MCASHAQRVRVLVRSTEYEVRRTVRSSYRPNYLQSSRLGVRSRRCPIRSWDSALIPTGTGIFQATFLHLNEDIEAVSRLHAAVETPPSLGRRHTLPAVPICLAKECYGTAYLTKWAGRHDHLPHRLGRKTRQPRVQMPSSPERFSLPRSPVVPTQCLTPPYSPDMQQRQMHLSVATSLCWSRHESFCLYLGQNLSQPRHNMRAICHIHIAS